MLVTVEKAMLQMKLIEGPLKTPNLLTTILSITQTAMPSQMNNICNMQLFDNRIHIKKNKSIRSLTSFHLLNAAPLLFIY